MTTMLTSKGNAGQYLPLNVMHSQLSSRLFKVSTRTYLDGVSLLHELKSVPDLLAEGLLGDLVDLKQLMPELKLPGKVSQC